MSSFQDDIQHFRMRYGALAEIITLNVGIYLGLGALLIVSYLVGASIWIELFIQDFLGLPANLDELWRRPWSLLTYIFVHAYPGSGGGIGAILHIAFNMLWLYWLGRIFQEYLGDRNTWATFLLGGLAGGVLYILMLNLLPAFSASDVSQSYLIGASGGVTAIIVGAATLLPDFRISLLFFGPVKIKYIALVMVILDMFGTMGGNAGGAFAHIGGAAWGYFFITYRRRGTDISAPFVNAYDWVTGLFKRTPKRTNLNVHPGGKAAAPRGGTGATSDAEIDRILDKIAAKGYESLSRQEKETLAEASRQGRT